MSVKENIGPYTHFNLTFFTHMVSRLQCATVPSTIIGTPSEYELNSANNCGTHVLGENIYLMSTVFFSFNDFTSMKR